MAPSSQKPSKHPRKALSLVKLALTTVIPLATLVLGYYTYVEIRDSNDQQASQDKPLFRFSDLANQELFQSDFSWLTDTTSSFCDNFRFVIKNVNDHPAGDVAIQSTVMYYDDARKPQVINFADHMTNVIIGKGNAVATRYHHYCFFLQGATNSTLQTDSVWWHARIRTVDAVTKKSDSQEIYAKILIRYDKKENNWSTDYFIVEPEEFKNTISGKSG